MRFLTIIILFVMQIGCQHQDRSSSTMASDSDQSSTVVSNQMRYDSYLGLEKYCRATQRLLFWNCIFDGAFDLGGKWKDNHLTMEIYTHSVADVKREIDLGRGNDQYIGCSLGRPCKDLYRD